MSLQELYNMITMLPEAGLEYLVNRMVPPNGLAQDEARALTQWISKEMKIDRTEVMRQILLTINKANIKWINNPTEEECLKAVYESPSLIEHIDNPTENVQMAAAKHGNLRPGQVLKLIKNPSRNLWKLWFEENPDAILNSSTDDEEFQMIAIRKKPSLINDSRISWCVAARREAFETDTSYFRHLVDQTEDDIWKALEHDSRNLQFVENPTQEMKAYCVFVA